MLTLLPAHTENQAYFKITPLDAGNLSLREAMLVSDTDPEQRVTVPAVAFLLQHSSKKHSVLFDLGINKDITKYSPAAQDRIKTYFQPCSADPDVVDSLEASGAALTAEKISHVIISHVHW